jgi:proline-rich tail region repeat protein
VQVTTTAGYQQQPPVAIAKYENSVPVAAVYAYPGGTTNSPPVIAEGSTLPTPPTQPAAPRQMTVTVPEGAQPGAVLTVASPDGTTVQVMR